jgi:hypothetical protein
MAEQDRHSASIDSAREEFLFLNINEMIAEFSEYQSPVADDLRPADGLPEEDEVPFTGRVLCIPAHDQADEIAAAMLSQLLDQHGCIALTFPGGPGLEEMLDLIAPGKGDLICISALPPYAFAPARGACRRIRAHFPGVPLIVGIWGFTGEAKKAMTRFDRTPPDHLFTSFEQVIEHLSIPDPAATQALDIQLSVG